jgi:DNA repair protein RadC
VKPGRKLVEQGAESLTDAEVLALLIGSGCSGHSAEDIARELIARFGSLAGLMDHPLGDMADIKGLGAVKLLRVAGAYELVRRIVRHLEHHT